MKTVNNPVTIKTRYYGDGYIATIPGTKLKSSSTNSALTAAESVGKKFFGRTKFTLVETGTVGHQIKFYHAKEA